MSSSQGDARDHLIKEKKCVKLISNRIWKIICEILILNFKVTCKPCKISMHIKGYILSLRMKRKKTHMSLCIKREYKLQKFKVHLLTVPVFHQIFLIRGRCLIQFNVSTKPAQNKRLKQSRTGTEMSPGVTSRPRIAVILSAYPMAAGDLLKSQFPEQQSF